MKITALALVGMMLSAAMPLNAQVAAEAAGAPAAPAEPKASCPCDNYRFKPLTDKARAAEAYWDARRKVKIAAVISGTGLIFSLIARSPNGLRESTESYDRVRSEMNIARAKAESLGAVKVTGDDLDGTIEFKLDLGVDYILTP